MLSTNMAHEQTKEKYTDSASRSAAPLLVYHTAVDLDIAGRRGDAAGRRLYRL